VPQHTRIIPNLLRKHQCHFAAHDLADIEFSNSWFLSNARAADAFDHRLARISWGTKPEYWHYLGTGLCLGWEAFEDFCSLKHDEGSCFLEIYLPSVLASRGWRGLNVNRHSDVYSHIRYRPLFSEDEFREAQTKGIPFLHPFKPEDTRALIK
jgi:hypothetical protein